MRTKFSRLDFVREKRTGPLLLKMIDEINEIKEHKATCIIADLFALWELDVSQQCDINARASF